MTIDIAVTLLREAIYTIFIVSIPILGITLIVGLLISIFQAATSINEMTMTYVPKIIVVAIIGIITLPWMLDILVGFTRNLFDLLPTMVK
jgi:flagellar biosynthetic protein FliQ